MKVLFPTDFSEHNAIAFRYACEAAYFLKGKLTIVHVLDQPEHKKLTEKEIISEAAKTNDQLRAFVKKNKPSELGDIKVNYHIKSGIASESIVGVTLDEEIDLIVIGTKGKTNALTAMMGSTSSAILAKADPPILFIPPDSEFNGIDSLIYTTNFEFRDLGALEYLKKWATAFDAQIHCVHMYDDPEDKWRIAKNMQILTSIYKRQKRMSFEAIQGYFKDDIVRYARRKKGDILAMISHKKGFISRLFEKRDVKGISQQLQIPILVIKDNAYELQRGSGDWITLINSIA